MKLCVIGTGYVGLVTGACFANLGNEVVCVDKQPARVAALKKGKVPFYEPGLDLLVARNVKAGRLSFSLDLVAAVKRSDVVFIAVGTPPKKSGEADISAVVTVARGIAAVLNSAKGFRLIVNKSTVPVGMGDIVTRLLLASSVPADAFAVVSNPEFLREGSAIADFTHPDRIVIGAAHNRAFNIIAELYRPLNAHIIFTSIKSAELIKYASNAFLATKISFINEIANICERTGSDIVEVADAVGLDKRIGRTFLNAGLGYGGSCLPKDVQALIHLARVSGYEPSLLKSVNELNNDQVKLFFDKIKRGLRGLKGKRLAVLGLAFKPETDDLRDAPALKLIARLKGAGARVAIFDPVAKGGLRSGVKMVKDAYSALRGADALVLVTEWQEFKELDFERIKQLMKTPVIFDGRNVYDPQKLKELGFFYQGVGR
jgi:UDPglucose 6-dehydrogenase